MTSASERLLGGTVVDVGIFPIKTELAIGKKLLDTPTSGLIFVERESVDC